MLAHEDKTNANNNTSSEAGMFTSRDFELLVVKNFQFILLVTHVIQ